MPTVVIATVIGAVVGGVIILLVLATLVSVAVGMACKRKVSTNNRYGNLLMLIHAIILGIAI